MKKSLSDQIKDLENTRAAKVARQDAVMTKSIEEGRSTDEEEGKEVDELELEVKQLDGDLVRLRAMERRQLDMAKSVDGGSSDAGHVSRGAPTIIVRKHGDKEDAFPGQSFVRKIIAKAAARLDDTSATHIAMQRWGKSNPMLVNIIKANEVPGAGTDAGEWGAELVQSDTRYTGDFVDYLYGQTVFDKLPLRNAPANVTVKGQDGAATGYWVGQSKAIPATSLDFLTFELKRLKVAALAVASNEWIRDSSPDAEMLVRDALVSASAKRIDQTFLSAAAGVPGVSPAGILNGLTGIAASGTDSDALLADLRALFASFIAANNSKGIHLIMNSSLALSVSMMRNMMGQDEFASLTEDGGTLRGRPVHTGDHVVPGQLIAIKPTDVYKIGDRGVEVSISRDAMVEQSTVPTGATDTPVAASQAFTSMFQEDSTAIKVIRPISFAKRRLSAVSFLTGANYG